MSTADRVVYLARSPRYGGGLHLDHLASLLGVKPGDRRMMAGVWHARRLGLVDVAAGYVIAELPGGGGHGQH